MLVIVFLEAGFIVKKLRLRVLPVILAAVVIVYRAGAVSPYFSIAFCRLCCGLGLYRSLCRIMAAM
ncbi:MAG: hypothetical protein DU429_02650 [Candidatus Tokpelaia sp.]|nr:MAG: hypothetical protein DU430_05400 [Candidatus Tokpelaia sp.]KAA6207376.1 MAG: hypothetical protein DU429_02650 [Candidatus Tokpelaia sp.]